MVIDFFAYFGWAWNLKTVSPQMLLKRRTRTGQLDNDKDTQQWKGIDNGMDTKHVEDSLWGRDDEQMPEELRKATQVLRAKRSS